jgi:eukaryotic-like serine/threonine-protein kinase
MDAESDDPVTLGRYKVVSRLGAGGMGRVLLGVDEAGRRVALKVVHAELAADPGFRERFRREVQMAAAAPPWFTAPVLDADPDAERPWLATAYVPGPSLQAYVSEHGPLAEQGTTALAVRMADGMVALHAAGLVHRDLKPSNVLLAEDGPRLIDFGISRAADTTALTQTGHVMGTPEFMSPEQAAGARDIGPASDMFALGSLLVYAATGRSPFAADSAAGALYRIVYSEPDLEPLAGRVREAVEACLAKDPAGRPSASQVRGLLRAGEVPPPADAAASDPASAATAVVPAVAPRPGAPGALRTTLVGAHPPIPPVGPPPGPPLVSPPTSPPAAGPSSRRRWVVIAAIAVAALLGAGIAVAAVQLLGRGGDRTVAAPGTADPSATPSGGASASGDPAAGATVIDAATDGRFGAGTARFATPSRNIACQMSADEVRCDVVERTWQVPPAPADCPLAYGTGASLTGQGAGTLTCAGDTVADPGLATLAYGQGVRLSGVVCVSRESGLRCENTGTRHGFRVSRGSYDLF